MKAHTIMRCLTIFVNTSVGGILISAIIRAQYLLKLARLIHGLHTQSENYVYLKKTNICFYRAT